AIKRCFSTAVNLKDFNVLAAELRAIAKTQPKMEMPDTQLLKSLGRDDLVHAIRKKHGGFMSVAQKLGWHIETSNGLDMHKKLHAGSAYPIAVRLWIVLDSLWEVTSSSGQIECFPCFGVTCTSDMLAIKRCFSTAVNLKDFNVLAAELRAIAKTQPKMEMPDTQLLKSLGRDDLVHAIRKKHGGFMSVAQKLGWHIETSNGLDMHKKLATRQKRREARLLELKKHNVF
ncbi:hypothetical protein AeMF1_020039, partial [Aphanomyces euteiches]